MEGINWQALVGHLEASSIVLEVENLEGNKTNISLRMQKVQGLFCQLGLHALI